MSQMARLRGRTNGLTVLLALTFDYTCLQIGGDGNLQHVPHVPDMNVEDSLRTN